MRKLESTVFIQLGNLIVLTVLFFYYFFFMVVMYTLFEYMFLDKWQSRISVSGLKLLKDDILFRLVLIKQKLYYIGKYYI